MVGEPAPFCPATMQGSEGLIDGTYFPGGSGWASITEAKGLNSQTEPSCREGECGSMKLKWR